MTYKSVINSNSQTCLRCSAKSPQLCKCAPACGLHTQPSGFKWRGLWSAVWLPPFLLILVSYSVFPTAQVWVEGTCRLRLGSSCVSQFKLIWWCKGRTIWVAAWLRRDFVHLLHGIPSLWPSFLSWLCKMSVEMVPVCRISAQSAHFLIIERGLF